MSAVIKPSDPPPPVNKIDHCRSWAAVFVQKVSCDSPCCYPPAAAPRNHAQVTRQRQRRHWHGALAARRPRRKPAGLCVVCDSSTTPFEGDHIQSTTIHSLLYKRSCLVRYTTHSQAGRSSQNAAPVASFLLFAAHPVCLQLAYSDRSHAAFKRTALIRRSRGSFAARC